MKLSWLGVLWAVAGVGLPVYAQSWSRGFLHNLQQVAMVSEFQPQQVVRRSQLATALDILVDGTRVAVSAQDIPKDVPANASSSRAIARMHKLKILQLHNGLFQPDRPVTKGEALLALARVLGVQDQRMDKPRTLLQRLYRDAHTIPDGQVVAIAALSARGLVVNYPDVHRLQLNQPLTQGELIALIHQGLVHQRRVARIASPYVVNPSQLLPQSVPQVSLLVVNLTRRELTAFQGEHRLKTYRIAVGRAGWETPVGDHRVQQMIEMPAWKNPFTGDVIPSGDPDNPLGKRWIGFWTNGKDWSGFHGTPNPRSVGQAVSHGCIRMYNEDIVELFPMVSTQTIVRVVR